MLNDLFRSRAAWRCRPLQQSPFRCELEEFAGWLKAAHYTTVILRRHVFRLDRTLRKMPGAAPGATFTTRQLQAAFGKHRPHALPPPRGGRLMIDRAELIPWLRRL